MMPRRTVPAGCNFSKRRAHGRRWRLSGPWALFAAAAVAGVFAACDEGASPATGPTPTSTNGATPAVAPETAPAPSPPPVVEVAAPEIIVDPKTVAVGKDSVSVTDPGLTDRAFGLLSGKPGIEGRTVSFVAMRNAKPSHVAAVAQAIFRAKASGAIVKSEARDNTTQGLALSSPATVADCAAVVWIAKNGSIAVWPAGGGSTKRVARGLAGPDLTLGLAAVRERREGCGAAELVLAAEDTIPWGVAFDLAEDAMSVTSAQANSVVLVTHALPGKKIDLR
ncbi:MAG TPA: hypothetical protein VK841_12575 [Polyangiaceae bacterium]|jgi:hypothetical protein|nr:hypothetical protein [Polyangiaceae bacterium]